MSIEHRLAIVFGVMGVLCFVAMVAAGMMYNSDCDPDRELRRKIHEWEKGGVE